MGLVEGLGFKVCCGVGLGFGVEGLLWGWFRVWGLGFIVGLSVKGLGFTSSLRALSCVEASCWPRRRPLNEWHDVCWCICVQPSLSRVVGGSFL